MILGPGYVQDLLTVHGLGSTSANDVNKCIEDARAQIAAQNKAAKSDVSNPVPSAPPLSATTSAFATHDKNAYLDPIQAARDILEISDRPKSEIYDEFGKVLNAANRPVNLNGWSAKDWKTFYDNLPAGQNNGIVINLLTEPGRDSRGRDVNQQIQSALQTLREEQDPFAVAAAGELGPNQVLRRPTYSFPGFERGLQVPTRTAGFQNFAGWYIVTAQPADPKANVQPCHFHAGSTVDDIKTYMRSINGDVVLTLAKEPLQRAVAVVAPTWTPPTTSAGTQTQQPATAILVPAPGQPDVQSRSGCLERAGRSAGRSVQKLLDHVYLKTKAGLRAASTRAKAAIKKGADQVSAWAGNEKAGAAKLPNYGV